jgi:Fur family ferric uptake transcriptional regulator
VPVNIEKVFVEKGISLTSQRRLIAETLLSSSKHLGAEELFYLVHKKNPRIGLATVYRTLQIMRENGIIEKRDFGDGCSRYEDRKDMHHDHLICMKCGNVIEFDEPTIENLQMKVAEKKRFKVVTHRLELFGYCNKCSK